MEAASVSRKVRLEELKRRKEDAASATAHSNGVKGTNSDEPLSLQLHFDEDDEAMQTDKAAADRAKLAERVRAWSTAKLVHSFRVLDRKQTRMAFGTLRDTIEGEIEGMQELVVAQHERARQDELDLHNIAPRRANWDLKRDMLKRLAKLQRRDRHARLILIRQRVSAAAGAGQHPGSGGAPTSGAQAAAAAGALGSGLLPEGGAQSDSEDDDDDDK